VPEEIKLALAHMFAANAGIVPIAHRRDIAEVAIKISHQCHENL
jgi:hypothetical protein